MELLNVFTYEVCVMVNLVALVAYYTTSSYNRKMFKMAPQNIRIAMYVIQALCILSGQVYTILLAVSLVVWAVMFIVGRVWYPDVLTAHTEVKKIMLKFGETMAEESK